MSQHFLKMTETNNTTVIKSGWDPELQEYYLIWGNLNKESNGLNKDLIIDFSTPFNPQDKHRTNELFETVKSILNSFNLTLPNSMFEEIANDIANNICHNSKLFHSDGTYALLTGCPSLVNKEFIPDEILLELCGANFEVINQSTRRHRLFKKVLPPLEAKSPNRPLSLVTSKS